MIEQQRPLTGRLLQPRAATRHKLFEPIVMRMRGTPQRAHLLDLSVGGALVHCEAPPLAGAWLMIETTEFVSGARVVWVRAKRFGIQFDAPIADAIVQRMIRSP
ncbi:PilZ domain-containing protein [Sphingobium ummariense]|uniref:PilZ domain-containing protein n=1 Tax=Sphingobium ummariense TaxID=420994 RepID=UPI0003FC64B8|nr:PilZ domain-containing protein [Sphingobium ummariense]